MKRWVFLAVLLLSGSAYAGFADSSAKMIATTIYEQLSMDTTGTAGYPRYLAVKHARDGIYQAGLDLGVERSKTVIISANTNAAKVDTAMIRMVAAVLLTNGYQNRWLRPVPPESLSAAVQFDSTITIGKRSTRFWTFKDSIYVSPIASTAETLAVHYYKQANYMADSSAMADLLQKYRGAARLYACYMASERLQNGRAAEFLGLYEKMVANIWAQRAYMAAQGEKK